jgi:hypothetical protein
MRFLTLAIIMLLLIAADSYFVLRGPAPQSPKSVATARRQVDPRQPSFATVIPKDDGSADASALRQPDALQKVPSAVARSIATIEEEDLLSSDVVPLGAMKNRGSATSLSAAESYLYAAGRGDHDSLAALFGFNASMPWATRIAYDALMPRLSANAAKEVERVSGVQLLERQVFGPNDELVRHRMIRMDGSKVDESFLMLRTDSGWRRDLGVKAYLLAKSQRGQ